MTRLSGILMQTFIVSYFNANTHAWQYHTVLNLRFVLQATSRLKKNGNYFRVNYLAFVLLVTVTCMVLNPTSLVVLGVLALVWTYFFAIRTSPVVIGGRTFRLGTASYQSPSSVKDQ